MNSAFLNLCVARFLSFQVVVWLFGRQHHAVVRGMFCHSVRA